MLNSNEKARFLAEANNKIAAAEERVLELKDLTRPIPPENAIGRISRMDAINNRSVNEAALRQLQAKLARMKEAVNKVEEPGFGICRSCGKKIPIGRLLLLPGSTMCVPCAE